MLLGGSRLLLACLDGHAESAEVVLGSLIDLDELRVGWVPLAESPALYSRSRFHHFLMNERVIAP